MIPLPSKPRSTPWIECLLRLSASLILSVAVLVRLASEASPHVQAPATGRDDLGFSGLVSIGERDLFVHCEGAGKPLVILEGGLGGGTSDWPLVQQELARHTRVCSYDRAGLGSSDPAEEQPHNATDASRDLQALLNVMRVDTPVVLVGFSIGGLLARYHASMHPRDVSALVLIDPTPPVWTAMTLSGYALRSRSDGLQEFSGLDPDAPEMLDILGVSEAVFTSNAPGSPVYMLTSGIKSLHPGMYGDERHQIATRLQEDQARELDAIHEVADLCTHYLPMECPDVVNAFILQVLDEAAEPPAGISRSHELYSSEPLRPRRKAWALFKVG